MPEDVGLDQLRERGGDVFALAELARDKGRSQELTDVLKTLGFGRLGDRVRLGHLLRAEAPGPTTLQATMQDLCGDGGVLKLVTRAGSGTTPKLPCCAKVLLPFTFHHCTQAWAESHGVVICR